MRAQYLVVGPCGMLCGDPNGGKHAFVGCAAYAMRCVVQKCRKDETRENWAVVVGGLKQTQSGSPVYYRMFLLDADLLGGDNTSGGWQVVVG